MLTYPWPPRPGRRVSIVCAPCRPRRTTPGPSPGTKGRRVMADPRATSSDVVRPDRPYPCQHGRGAATPTPGPSGTGCRRTPGQHGRGAGSALSACHGERHRACAGRPAPAAPGGLAPHPCQSPHPDLLVFLLHHLVIAACSAIQPPAQCRPTPCPLPWSLLRGRAGEGATTHPPSASCHPSAAPPAVVLHRVFGLFTPAPRPRPTHGRRPKKLPM